MVIVIDSSSGKIILLYGLNEDREIFFNSLKEGKVKRNNIVIPKGARLQNYMIDSYNLELSDFLRRMVNELRENYLWQDFLNKWFMRIPKKMSQLPLWPDFLYHLFLNDKNRLEQIYQGTTLVGCYGGSYYSDFILKKNEKLFIYFDLHVMRGCKIGIDIARTNPNVFIYFSIDELNMQSVLNRKRGDSGLNATNRELRYIYRHWQELKEKVHFFMGEEEVPAPWIAGEYKKLWEDYQPKSWHATKRNFQESKINDQSMFKGCQQMSTVILNNQYSQPLKVLWNYVCQCWQSLVEKPYLFKESMQLPVNWVAREQQQVVENLQLKSWHGIKRNLQAHQTTNQPMFKEQEKVVNEYLKDHREQQSPRSFIEIRQQAIISTPSNQSIKERGSVTHKQLEK